MVTATKLRRVLYGAFLTLVGGLVVAQPTNALTNAQLQQFSQNNILFYDPDGGNTCTAAATTIGNSNGSDVYLIGDSISTDTYAGDEIKAALPGAIVNAIGSTWFSNTVDSDLPSGVQRVRENISEIESRGILVFMMGTNGGVSESDINALFEALSGKNVKIILMTIYYADHYADAQMEDSNTIVRSTADNNANVTYVDWYGIASQNPSLYITPDAVHAHPTHDGSLKFADLIKTAVNKVTTMVGTNNGTGAGASGGAYEKLKDATRQYGEYAMQMQIEFGTPWEVVMAQMQIESGTGTCTNCVASSVAESGAYNWLGITGSGDAGSWVSSTGRSWAKFSSVEKSIEAWAGTKVLRNGYYNDAFPYLDINNWDLEAFLVKMISHYAPSSDGNNEAGYVQKILALLNGPIKEVREEMGWSSSEEFAKQNNIPVGGKYPIGTDVVASGSLSANSSYSSSYCTTGGSGTVSSEGVTVTNIDGLSWAFPLASATKDNYLRNSNENLRPYWRSCGSYNCVSVLSQPTSWYHHCEREGGSDCLYKVDLGIMQQLVDGHQRTAEEYNNRYGTSVITGDDLRFYSTGATVVAMASGTVTNVAPYMGMSYCKQVSIRNDSGYPYPVFYYTHMSMDDTVGIGQHVDAGQPIGEVGAPNCTGNGSQAHVHVDTQNYGDNIHPLIQALYDALPENATALASRQQANSNASNGLTEQQAKNLATRYKNNADEGLWNVPGNSYGIWNCVSLTAYFVQRFTTIGKVSRAWGNGKDVAEQLAKDYNLQTGSSPKPFSVFSVTKGTTVCQDGYLCGHTGVVVAVNGNDVMTIEAAYGNVGYTEVKHRDISYFTNDKYGYAFTYIDSIMNDRALEEAVK